MSFRVFRSCFQHVAEHFPYPFVGASRGSRRSCDCRRGLPPAIATRRLALSLVRGVRFAFSDRLPPACSSACGKPRPRWIRLRPRLLLADSRVKGNLGWAETPGQEPGLLVWHPGPHRQYPVPKSRCSGSFPGAQALSCPGPLPKFFPQEAWPPGHRAPHGCCPRTSTEPRILGADLSLLGWLVPLRQGPQGSCTQ